LGSLQAHRNGARILLAAHLRRHFRMSLPRRQVTPMKRTFRCSPLGNFAALNLHAPNSTGWKLAGSSNAGIVFGGADLLRPRATSPKCLCLPSRLYCRHPKHQNERLFRRLGRSVVVWAELHRPVATRCDLCRQDPQGNRAGQDAVEQPTKFELVINPKTAAALGLKIRSRCGIAGSRPFSDRTSQVVCRLSAARHGQWLT